MFNIELLVHFSEVQLKCRLGFYENQQELNLHKEAENQEN